jgi:hypothetical protein
MPSKSKENKIKGNQRYFSSERGYFTELFNSLRQRCGKTKYKRPGRKIHEMDIRDRHHLIELWHKQCQALGGPYCIFTGVEMTTIKNRGGGRGQWKNRNKCFSRQTRCIKTIQRRKHSFLHLGV